MKCGEFLRLARNEMRAVVSVGRKHPSLVVAPAIQLAFGRLQPNPCSVTPGMSHHWYARDVSEELTGQIPALGLLLTPSSFLLLVEVKGIGARTAMQDIVTLRMRKLLPQQ